jgi:hypothetical protein
VIEAVAEELSGSISCAVASGNSPPRFHAEKMTARISAGTGSQCTSLPLGDRLLVHAGHHLGL